MRSRCSRLRNESPGPSTSTRDESSIGQGSRSWKCSHGSCRSGISSGSMRPTVRTATCRSSPVSRLTSRTVDAVRRPEPLDLFGEREQVTLGPFAVGRAGQHGRRRHAERDRPVQQPLQLGRGDPATAHAERAEHLVELLDHAGPALAFGVAGAAVPEQARRSVSANVSPSVRRANEMPRKVCPSAWFIDSRCRCAADQMVAPARRAGHVGQRPGGVVVDAAGPLVRRERPRRAPQVQPEAGQAGVLLRDRRRSAPRGRRRAGRPTAPRAASTRR